MVATARRIAEGVRSFAFHKLRRQGVAAFSVPLCQKIARERVASMLMPPVPSLVVMRVEPLEPNVGERGVVSELEGQPSWRTDTGKPPSVIGWRRIIVTVAIEIRVEIDLVIR